MKLRLLTMSSRRISSYVSLVQRRVCTPPITFLLEQGDHAIVIAPNYQAAETVPLMICAVTGASLDPAFGWELDIDRVAAAVRPDTKLISINFPHNSTGRIITPATLNALIGLCRKHGLWLISDEVYRLLGAHPERQLPQVELLPVPWTPR